MQKTFIVIFVLTLISCSNNQTKSDTNQDIKFPVKPLYVESGDESMGADIKLSFTESTTSEKSVTYRVNSTYGNENIGFILIVPRHGLAKLSIRTEGKNSDNFIHALQKLYKQKIDSSSKFVNTISATCMNMGDYVDSLNKQSDGNYVSIAENKLFFQGEKEDDYAELYLNINDAEHWIELKEKDEEYRPILIKLLTQH